MINKKGLCKFIIKASRATYAAGDAAKKIIEKDKSTTLTYKDGDWRYHDNYFGGEPFGGREVVFYKNNPIYFMTYYGRVDAKVSDIEKVYKVLQGALSLIPKDKPFRGPRKYKNGQFQYNNSWTGDVDDFSGEEYITENGKEVYRAKYLGGYVDQRK